MFSMSATKTEISVYELCYTVTVSHFIKAVSRFILPTHATGKGTSNPVTVKLEDTNLHYKIQSQSNSSFGCVQQVLTL